MVEPSYVGEVLFTAEEIQAGIRRLCGELMHTYKDKKFSVVSVLKGAAVFTADLIRQLPGDLKLNFIVVSSYHREQRSSGSITVEYMPPSAEFAGQRILLVDDILDTGMTLSHLQKEILLRGAREVKTCVLLEKRVTRTQPIRPDFRCFFVDNIFVVGYGLDLAERYRNLPFIGVPREATR